MTEATVADLLTLAADASPMLVLGIYGLRQASRLVSLVDKHADQLVGDLHRIATAIAKLSDGGTVDVTFTRDTEDSDHV